jgi:glycosyltransferase involved in cell wall biosynthesis
MGRQAAIYDPYLDTLGGGERYCLTVAEILLNHGYSVDLFWSGNPKLVEKAEQRFSLNLKKLNIVPDIFGIKPQKIDLIEEKHNLVKFISHSLDKGNLSTRLNGFVTKFKTTRNYDLIFYLSDGSTPFLFSKKNILHIQVPFYHQSNIRSIISDLIKLKLISKVICNSKFTARFQKETFKNKVSVLYPPVDLDKFNNKAPKKKIILSVGRFDNILNAKKQDILIDAFKNLVEKENITGWKLVFAGGSLLEPENNSYLKCLKEKSKNLPIEFEVNPNFNELQKIYSEASIYWHAAGFEVDENRQPENTEHFGITIVEAMISGLVPVVIAKGGIPEIIENGVNGYLWNSIEELILKTKRLIENPDLINEMSGYAISTCDQFSKENFEKQLIQIIEN